MDPVKIIEIVAGVIARATSLAPDVISTVEGAKPLAGKIVGLFKTEDVTQEALDALVSGTHGLSDTLQQPVPPEPPQGG